MEHLLPSRVLHVIFHPDVPEFDFLLSQDFKVLRMLLANDLGNLEGVRKLILAAHLTLVLSHTMQKLDLLMEHQHLKNIGIPDCCGLNCILRSSSSSSFSSCSYLVVHLLLDIIIVLELDPLTPGVYS